MSSTIGTHCKWVEKELGAANWRRRGREERKEGRKEKKMRAAEDAAAAAEFFWAPSSQSSSMRRKEGRRFRSIENEEGIISLPISNCGFD